MSSIRRLCCFALLVTAACGGGDGGTNPPPPTQVLGSIVATPATMNLNAGQRQVITVAALDDKGATISGVSGYAFSSGNLSVATVVASGEVTALSAGTATVTVSLTRNGVTKTAGVVVTVTGLLPLTATVAAGTQANDFTPALVVLRRSGVVTYTFGARTHNVQFGGAAGAPADIPNSTSAVVDRQFNNPGAFGYVCTLHGGMSGNIVVP